MADDTENEGSSAPLTSADYITTKQAASLLGTDPWNLKRRRMASFQGPPGPPWYRRMGRVFYLKKEVLAFLEAKQAAPAPAPPVRPRFPAHPGTRSG
jgi:hypothetical protein